MGKKRNNEYLGKKINHLTIIKFNGQDKYKQHLVDALCDCGKITNIPLSRITSNHTKSCGCANIIHKQKHKLSGTKFYNCWRGIFKRISLISRNDYHRYGGRGIKVDKKWERFISFKEDMYESFSLHCLEHGVNNTSLDRIDNNGNYNKENCRWSTYEIQANNRSSSKILTLNEVSMTKAQWARKIGVSSTTINDRLSRGWSVEKTLTTKKHEKE